MKRLILSCALALSTLCFNAPASAAIPPPLPRSTDSFDAGSLHVDVFGTNGKPAIVLIPGLACGPWEWSGEIRQLAPNYSIYAMTLPGFDGRPGIGGDLFKTVTADFWMMLDAHHLANPALVGHSLGGTLAIILAEQHPSRLRGVIAVDGLPVFPGFDRMSPVQREQSAQRMQAMMADATPAQFAMAERTSVLPQYMRASSDVDAVTPLIAKSDPKAVGAWFAADVLVDARGGLKDISVPVFEIAPYDASLESAYVPSAAAKQTYYESLLSGDASAKVQMIDGSRHFVMYDRPKELGAAIAGDLTSLY